MKKDTLSQQSVAQAALLIEGLAVAKSDNEFSCAMELAEKAFDHVDVHWHNHLMQAGVLSVLLKCLERLLSKGRWAFVHNLCNLMCMLFRCSDQQASRSIASSDGELLHLAIATLRASCGESKGSSSISALVIRISELQVNLENMKASGRFLSLCRLLLEESTTGGDSQQTVILLLQLLCGITQNQVGSTRVFMEQPGLFESLVSRLLGSFVPDSQVNFPAAKLFHGLALRAETRFIMVKNHAFSKLFILLLGESSVETQHEAMLTFKLLAIERFSRQQLFRDGMGRILDASIQSPENLQRSSLQTLLYLINDETAVEIYKSPGFLRQLENIVAAQPSTDAGLLSARVINRLSTYLHVHSKGKGAMLESIMSLISSGEERVRYWGTRALLEQSRVKPSSFFLSRTEKLLDLLTTLSREDCQRVRETAIEVLFNLATHEVNLPVLANKRGLLDALGIAIAKDSAGNSVARRQAILVVLCLSRHERSRKIVAKHCSIVNSLAKFGVSNDDDNELRGAALHGVIWLSHLM